MWNDRVISHSQCSSLAQWFPTRGGGGCVNQKEGVTRKKIGDCQMIKEVGWNQIHSHGHSNEKVWEEKMTLVELAVDIASFLREHTHTHTPKNLGTFADNFHQWIGTEMNIVFLSLLKNKLGLTFNWFNHNHLLTLRSRAEFIIHMPEP